MDTTIADALDDAGIPHRIARFDPTLSADAAADSIGLPTAAMARTLAMASMPAVVLAVLPGLACLDLDALRRHLGENRTMPLNDVALERMTGFRPDTITPLPQPGRRRFRVIVDASLLTRPEVSVAGGEPGLAIAMTPSDLLRATGGEAAELMRVR